MNVIIYVNLKHPLIEREINVNIPKSKEIVNIINSKLFKNLPSFTKLNVSPPIRTLSTFKHLYYKKLREMYSLILLLEFCLYVH